VEVGGSFQVMGAFVAPPLADWLRLWSDGVRRVRGGGGGGVEVSTFSD
jgi:hypothetical protein